MFQVPLALLLLLVGSGESLILFDKFIDFALTFAADQLHGVLTDRNYSANALGTSLLESADAALGGIQAAEEQSKKLEEIHNAVYGLNFQILGLTDYMQQQLDYLQDDLKGVTESVLKHQSRLSELISYINAIHQKYDEFRVVLERYLKMDIALSEKSDVLEFAERTVSEAPGELRERLGVMHAIFNPFKSTGTFEEGLFLLMADDLNAQYDIICGVESPQQKLYRAYKVISIMDFKGYMILKYSYDILSVFDKTKYSREQVGIANDYIKRRSGYVNAIDQALSVVGRYLRACSPPYRMRDKNFIELEGLYGSYIINEIDMEVKPLPEKAYEYATIRNAHNFPNDVFIAWKYNCVDYTCEGIQSMAANIQQKQYNTGYDKIYRNKGNDTCRGNIYNCMNMGKSGQSSTACVESSHGARYQHIKTKDGVYGVYGTHPICEPFGKTVKLDMVRAAYFACDYCLCQCHNSDDNAPNVVKWINVNDHISDIQKNMVITGVKFEKNGTKIEMKIKEGVLATKGEVPESKWTSGFQGNADYLEIGESFSKSLVLNSYEAEDGYILTGLRFKRYFGKYFGIQIHCTEFDFDSGELNTSSSHWVDIIKPNEIGHELTLESPDDPTRSPVDYQDSVDGDYVTFVMSDLGKTAGGFVVPFIDTVRVESAPGFALTGAGLIHKGKSGYGGFVAFQLITHDLCGYINDPQQTSST